jgi:phosphotransferase system IIB component
MNLKDNNFVQIVFGLTVVRAYYIDKQYLIYQINHEEILPYTCRTATEATEYLYKMIENKTNINFQLFFSCHTQQKLKKKIMEMEGEYERTKYKPMLKSSMLVLLRS